MTRLFQSVICTIILFVNFIQRNLMYKEKDSFRKEKLASGKTILVLGASGLVGSRFVEFFGGANVLTLDSKSLDITDKMDVAYFIERHKPDIIVNFVAYTNVTEAEKQRGDINGECYRTNVIGVQNFVDAIGEISPEKTEFIQISTDMTMTGFEDDPGPYAEDHLAEIDSDKLTWYGYTKAEAERVVKEKLGARAIIVRIICPVRRKFEGKLDYLAGPLAKFDAGLLKAMFGDQQISITDIDELCAALAKIIEGKKHGVFHDGSSDTGTPYEIISYLLKVARDTENYLGKSSLKDLIAEGKVDLRRYH